MLRLAEKVEAPGIDDESFAAAAVVIVVVVVVVAEVAAWPASFFFADSRAAEVRRVLTPSPGRSAGWTGVVEAAGVVVVVAVFFSVVGQERRAMAGESWSERELSSLSSVSGSLSSA